MQEAKGLSRMKYSSLIERISGEGADAWVVHYEARRALDRGESVILLSVGDPDLDSPAPVIERRSTACGPATPITRRLRAGSPCVRRLPPCIARAAASRGPGQRHFPGRAQNALFAASLCLAGFGDEVIAFEPLYPPIRRPSKCRRAPGAGPARPRRVSGSTCGRSRHSSRRAPAQCSSPRRTIRAA